MAGRPKMCASCGKLMGVADTCPYCGADNKKIGLRLKRVAAGGSAKSAYPVTMGFVIANVFLFVVALGVGGMSPGAGMLDFGAPTGEMLFRLGSMYPPAVDAGDWWRIITAIFLHGGVLHVFFNTYILWVAGRHVESEVGPRLMFFVYMATGILGFVASYSMGMSNSVGASGAVSGVLGYVLVRRRLVDGNFRHPLTMWVIQLIVLTAIFGVVVAHVDNAAHVGGIVSGAGLAYLLTTVKLSKAGVVTIMLLTTGLAVVTVVALVSMGLSLSRGSAKDLIAAEGCADSGRQALTRGGLGVDPQAANEAVACFGDTSTLTGDASDALEAMAQSLAEAREAHEHSDIASEQDATHRYLEAYVAFKRWISANYVRYYGLSLVGSPHERPPTSPHGVEPQ